MKLALLLAVAVGGCAASSVTEKPEPVVTPPVAQPSSYDVTATTETGWGTPFRAHLACRSASDSLVSGSCLYENATPEPGTESSGIDKDGWFCAGTMPHATPYGWVVVSIHCEE